MASFIKRLILGDKKPKAEHFSAKNANAGTIWKAKGLFNCCLI